LGGFGLLGRGLDRRGLGVGGGERWQEGACGSERACGTDEVAGRELQVGSHHLKLYSEIVDAFLRRAGNRKALRGGCEALVW
jgi:hypothetical protein